MEQSSFFWSRPEFRETFTPAQIGSSGVNQTRARHESDPNQNWIWSGLDLNETRTDFNQTRTRPYLDLNHTITRLYSDQERTWIRPGPDLNHTQTKPESDQDQTCQYGRSLCLMWSNFYDCNLFFFFKKDSSQFSHRASFKSFLIDDFIFFIFSRQHLVVENGAEKKHILG